MSNYLVTYSGNVYSIGKLDAKEVHIYDIAHALSYQRRFGGHLAAPWSVAEHSIKVAQLLAEVGHGPDVQLQGLMHDAHEAYVTDVPTPLKTAEFRKWERQAERAVRKAMLLPDKFHPDVKKADEDLCTMEARRLHDNAAWPLDRELNFEIAKELVIQPTPPGTEEHIKARFRFLYYQLAAGNQPFQGPIPLGESSR